MEKRTAKKLIAMAFVAMFSMLRSIGTVSATLTHELILNKKKTTQHKIFTVFGIVALLTCMLMAAGPAAAGSTSQTEFPRNNMAPDGRDIMDATAEMLGEKEIAIRKHAALVGAAVATGASPIGEPANVGDEFIITVSDMGIGTDYEETFMVVMDGLHGIILVEKAAYGSFDGTYYHFPNPYGDSVSPDPWKRTEDLISHTQLKYLLNEFDNNIYPTDTSIFGEPLPRGDEGQKVWILIHNIRDEAYYDSEVQWYIAGYFSASEDAENNKNMMHIDSYDWANRIGSDVARPYLYEGVFAHEFEHLIHFDSDPDEPSWVDEGLANMAGFLCGYGHSSGHVAYYMVYHPMTSLTFWGGGLEDYGASYLFQLYLYEKYGGTDFTSALVQEQANGIAGIENTLATLGYNDITFDDIFDNWTIANYMDDTHENDLYGYNTLDIGTIDSWGYSIEYVLQNVWVGDPLEVPFVYPISIFDNPQPYTAHYHRFGGQPTLRTALDGDDTTGTPAYNGTYEWYSDAEAWAWHSFNQTFDIPTGGATLNFYTFYEIEEDWDYGYVEVYDHNTDEWYTLNATGTVDYVAYAQDNPNVPAGREPSDYEANDRWHAFTGNCNDWISVSMNLTPFAGHTIDIYFRTWQDGAFTLQMMYVDDISIPEIGFFDDVEAGEDGWMADGWYRTNGILSNNWQATLIESRWQPTDRYPQAESWHARKLLDETRMTMDSDTQSGEITGITTTPVKSRRTQVLIVSNRLDHILPSDYWVEFTN
ncbi:MAG: immune inhibitor A [Methanosarcinales archaeon]|nr:immune inhibitor A [Methanosarcinales archaeon]